MIPEPLPCHCLEIKDWIPNGVCPHALFPPGTKIKIENIKDKEYRLSWPLEQPAYSTNLFWNETNRQLQNSSAEVLAADGTNIPALAITIPYLLESSWWYGKFRRGGIHEGNTGVFIAQQDPQPPPYEPKDGRGTSTAE